MVKEALKRIFDFLERKGEHKAPFIWKLKNNIPLTEDELNVKGDLILTDINITSLPEGLKVEGTLELDETIIKSLPEGLEVGGNLDLSGSLINSLPKGLKVGGKLYIYRTPISEDYYHEDIIEMIKPGFIKGEIIG
jgi:hypothetical protein